MLYPLTLSYIGDIMVKTEQRRQFIMPSKSKIITAALAACIAVTAVSGCSTQEEVTKAQTSIAVSMENVDVLETVLGTTTTTAPEEGEETSVPETTTAAETTTKAITTTTVSMPAFTGVNVSYDTTGVVDENAIKALEAARKGAEAIANDSLEDMLRWIYFPIYIELCSGGTAVTFEEEKIQEWLDLAIEDGRNVEQTWALNYAMYQDLRFYNPVRLTDEEIADLKNMFKETKLVGEPKSIEHQGYRDYEYTPNDKQCIYKVNVIGESISKLYTTDETPYMYVVGLPEYNWDTHENELKFQLDALMVYLEQGYFKLDELTEFEGRYKDGQWNDGGDKDNITNSIFIPFKDVFYKRQKPAETDEPDTTAPAETTSVE